ncbi:hypothetical protein CHT98_14630 (plasmid) [Azospirillum brasilense]|uniref:Quercetin 2,3-dioxygenase C-terminal cupin domain-containing protein n=1 Tax=Azospirillum brasilense TaxID=192 RepID=A0A235HD38_AZOBR|nr:hypothetical protein CHT98_14630 [Azospirillum brasilense]
MIVRPAAGVEQIVLPSVRDLGHGFQVRRALPSAQRRMVGPVIFLDSFGPVAFHAGAGVDTRPHPHIGLSTLTRSFSDLFSADVALRDGARFRIGVEHAERAVYVVDGAVEVVAEPGTFGKDRLIVFKTGAEIVLRAVGRQAPHLVELRLKPARAH